ncbi:hypothetical protein ARMGADRAFT_770710 [Armillaria gallica]|uniref:Uncharacterized protein n=1 Tax=Armillaria gallica TaxID=47427 RepID=A0A2H3D2R3_ARMGA|nr:hypothetical protein ARMGADRAFT_770710 [Armillaria gallica]
MMSEPDWFFTVAITASSSKQVDDDAIETVRKAYRMVFGRSVPARDQDNHLLLWTQTCLAFGVSQSIVKELRDVLPALPNLTWPSVARVVGLDPSLGREQLPEKPVQTLLLPTNFLHDLLGCAQRSAIYRRDNEQYFHMGSLAVKDILIRLGGFIYDTEAEGLDALDFELELRMVHNTTLLVVESKRSASSDVHAQAIAEATCLAASNSRLGYSIPITVIVTNREETTFYTYNPPEKKFYFRTHLKIEYFRSECDLEDVQELQLQRMTVIRASEPFSRLLTSFDDSHSGTGAVLFDSGRISRFHPGNDTPFSLALSFATIRRGDRTTQRLR